MSIQLNNYKDPNYVSPIKMCGGFKNDQYNNRRGYYGNNYNGYRGYNNKYHMKEEPKDTDEYPCEDEQIELKNSYVPLVTSGQGFKPINNQPLRSNGPHDKNKPQIISVDPTIQNAYEQIINQTENKQYDDNGDLLNPDDEFFMYDGEDHYKPYNLEKKGTYNEWRDQAFEWDVLVNELNQKVFGNKCFFEPQKEIINAALSKRDVIALIPTGGGKSLTFQLPALVDVGYTFVIMPLISLIEDQIYQLEQKNIKCFKYGKFNSENIQKNFLKDLLRGSDPNMRLIYLTPEKLVQSQSFTGILDKLYASNRISRFVIDEVHCLSHWGQDFRKDYRELNFLRFRYPNVPITALTATATIAVKYDIVKHLKLKNVVFFQSSFNRPNLVYEIKDKSRVKNLAEDIIMQIREKFLYQSGIIYCLSRQECEELCSELSEYDVKCDYYHAHLSDAARKAVQIRWMRNEIHIIIATIAFGLGINKKDVRFVIHTTIPKSLENYCQECGRAGRDGKEANCILYYSYADRKRLEYFIISNTENTSGRKNENLYALYKILEFCEEPYLCRRKVLLNYLGEDFRSKQCNTMCDNCKKGFRVGEIDFTEQARYIVAMVESALRKKMDLTILQICKFLQGKKQGISNPNKTTKMDDIKQAFFGKLSDYSEEQIKRMCMKLLVNKVLKEKFNSFQVENTILVYLIPGRLIENFKKGQIRIILTDCLDKDCENEYQKLKKKEERDFNKKKKQELANEEQPNINSQDQQHSQSKSKKQKKPPQTFKSLEDQLLSQLSTTDNNKFTKLDQIKIKSLLTDVQRDELYQRLDIVKQKLLENHNGKQFYLLAHTFTNDFLQIMTFIMPMKEDQLLDNHLLILTDENRQFIEKYLEVFMTEIRYFVGQYGLHEQIKKKGAYQLMKESTMGSSEVVNTESNDPTPQKLGIVKKVKKEDKFSAFSKKFEEQNLDALGEQLIDKGLPPEICEPTSDLELKEVKQQNQQIGTIRKRVIKRKKKLFQKNDKNSQNNQEQIIQSDHQDYGFSDNERKANQSFQNKQYKHDFKRPRFFK